MSIAIRNTETIRKTISKYKPAIIDNNEANNSMSTIDYFCRKGTLMSYSEQNGGGAKYLVKL